MHMMNRDGADYNFIYRTTFRRCLLILLTITVAKATIATEDDGSVAVWMQQFCSTLVKDDCQMYFAHCDGGKETVTKKSCCHAIQQAMMTTRNSFDTQQCLKQTVAIHNFQQSSNENLSLGYPSYTAWLSLPANELNDHTTVNIQYRFFPPKSRTIANLAQRGYWKDERSDVVRLQTTPSDSLEYRNLIESSLDENETGMHRLIHHRIFVTTNSTTSYFVLLYIPSDLFVNTEDLLIVHSSNSNNTSVQLLLQKQVNGLDYLIDQEEPEFVSPPHALILKVKVDGSHTEQQVSYSIKIHVRYPLPSSHRFRRVIVPPPVLLRVEQGNGNGQSQKVLPLCNGFPLEMWISTGYPGHLHFVAITSILASVVGSILMLRDIARVSVWE